MKKCLPLMMGLLAPPSPTIQLASEGSHLQNDTTPNPVPPVAGNFHADRKPTAALLLPRDTQMLSGNQNACSLYSKCKFRLFVTCGNKTQQRAAPHPARTIETHRKLLEIDQHHTTKFTQKRNYNQNRPRRCDVGNNCQHDNDICTTSNTDFFVRSLICRVVTVILRAMSSLSSH